MVESIQVPAGGPQRRDSVPAVKLLFENLSAHLFQTLAGLFFVLTRWWQVDRRLSLKILQIQFATGLTTIAVRLMVIILSMPNAFPLRQPANNSSSASRPAARGVGWLHSFQRGSHPGGSTGSPDLGGCARHGNAPQTRGSLCATILHRRRSCAPGRIPFEDAQVGGRRRTPQAHRERD